MITVDKWLLDFQQIECFGACSLLSQLSQLTLAHPPHLKRLEPTAQEWTIVRGMITPGKPAAPRRVLRAFLMFGLFFVCNEAVDTRATNMAMSNHLCDD